MRQEYDEISVLPFEQWAEREAALARGEVIPLTRTCDMQGRVILLAKAHLLPIAEEHHPSPSCFCRPSITEAMVIHREFHA